MSSIGRAIKAGRLAAPKTDDGRLAIDPAELARVLELQLQAEPAVETHAAPSRASSSPRSSARGPRLAKNAEAIGPQPQVRRG
jgi:hypothetical protein